MSKGKLPVTNFDVIESDKENVLPLRNGRSASTLSLSLRQKSNAEHSETLTDLRLEYERKILEELDDMDDPLELYLDYISWINNAYPQGGQSKQSGMLDILERCLMYFKDFETYKNDPRYLKVWLWYLELFSSSSDERKNLFVYMMRKDIGVKLALFYEEFASLLVAQKLYLQANELLLHGIDIQARPTGRLRKSLQYFEEQMRQLNVDLSSRDSQESIFEQDGPDFILGKQKSQITESSKTKPLHMSSLKHTIFHDIEENQRDNNLRKDGWEYLDSKVQRDKENRLISSQLKPGQNVGKLTQHGSEANNNKRLPIFKDSLGRGSPVYKILEIPGRKSEKVDCNFDLIYPNATEEYCIEEILAISRNVYQKQSHAEFETQKLLHSPDLQIEDQSKKKRQKLALRPKIQLHDKPNEEHHLPPEDIQDTLTYKRITTSSTLPLKDDEDTRSERKKSRPSSPTVTLYSKDAMDEVYSMFNQDYSKPKQLLETDDTTSKFAVYENFTQEFTRKTLDDLTEARQLGGDMIQKTPRKSPEATAIDKASKETTTPTYKSKLQEYMTPIQERPETFKLNSEHDDDNTDKKNFDSGTINSTESSPFLTQPQTINVPPEEQKPVIDNPLNDTFRSQLLESVDPPLSTYDNFYSYNQCLRMSSVLKRIHQVSKNVKKNPIVDFKKTNDLYCIRAELGEGGYATVYLAESSTGSLKALKVEKPASIWEFYILKQVEKRLDGEPILRSIINVDSLHCFQDESYLVLNYASQGTVLDLINLERDKYGSSLDETLCMFIAIELMKVLECIHDVGIIHGDLKPDNCMIRFEECSELLGDYDANGKNGWSSKGIYLIDFGRSFDLTLFELGTRFKANWKTDQQDCPEMREGRLWSYEADYYGLAGIIHAMLFGKFIETRSLQNGKYELISSLKRYWNHDLWSPFFDLLINSNQYGNLPITAKLREQRLLFEMYLEREGGGRLKSQITSLEPELAKFKQ